MSATCSETAATGGGGVEICARLLCHPENAGLTAIRCERKCGRWQRWGWTGCVFGLCCVNDTKYLTSCSRLQYLEL